MKDHYTIQEFYLLLKLGIFRNGKVGNWGYVSSGSINEFFLKKNQKEYRNQNYAKKQLGIGIYLLDLYQLEKQNNQGVFIMFIATCRTTLSQKEKIYRLRLTSVFLVNDVKLATEEGTLSRKRKSIFRKSPLRRRIDASPINSVRGQH